MKLISFDFVNNINTNQLSLTLCTCFFRILGKTGTGENGKGNNGKNGKVGNKGTQMLNFSKLLKAKQPQP